MRLINILFSITILVLSAFALTELCFPQDHLNDIVDNWKRLPIYDIVTVDSGDSCPFGF